MFLIEGRRLVEEALQSDLSIAAFLWNTGGDEPPADVLDRVRARGIPVYELSVQAFGAVSDTVTPQGCIAVAKMPAPGDTPAARPLDLLLDGLQDPGNVGTLIRTAHALGATGVCCGTGTVDPYAPKVVRASMGGLFHLPVTVAESVDHIRRWKDLHPQGRVVVAMADAATACDELDLRCPLLMVIGSEASGVSAEVARLASDAVRIPMPGGAESLNAAVSGAILLYEAARQRRCSAGPGWRDGSGEGLQ
ncbi:MAG: RNA methyltransferase [Alicyclobacillus sp.]|nr:RNA methyltransferase [Alicyclobacillus sp.]